MVIENVMRWRPNVERWLKAVGINIPASFVLAVIHQESRGLTHATRYEEGYHERYAGTPKFHIVQEATGYSPEAIATSYGLMQLMLLTAWGYASKGYRNKTLIEDALYSGDENIRYGVAHLGCLLRPLSCTDWTVDVLRQLAGAYNGSDVSGDYADSVMRLYDAYDAIMR